MKDYHVKITDLALRDMEAIYSYIAGSLASPDTAMKLYNRIAREIESLSTFPERYPLMRSETENRMGLRRMLIGGYSAFYRICDDEVVVVRVLYSASDISTRLAEDEIPFSE